MMSDVGLLDRRALDPESSGFAVGSWEESEQLTIAGGFERRAFEDSLRTLFVLGLDQEAQTIAHAVGLPKRAQQLRSAATRWLPSALGMIEDIRQLGDDWDGYGSPGLSRAAIDSGNALLLAVDSKSLPAPHVSPIPGGGLQIEWHSRLRDLEIEVTREGIVEFSAVENGNAVETGQLEPDLPERLVELVNWLTS